MERFLAAAVQLNSTDDKERNLEVALRLVGQASERGAQFVALPENTDLIGPHGVKVAAAEELGGPTFQLFAEEARRRGIWLLLGSIGEKSTEEGKARNTSVLYDPDGKLVAVYR